jgi:hypothetical protein
MKLGWLWLVLGAAVLAAAAEDNGEPEEDERDDRTKYAVYEKRDWRGTDSYDIIPAADYAELVAEARRTNRVLRDAYRAAREAWEADEKNQGTRFPLGMPRYLRVRRLSIYRGRDRAEAAAAKRQDRLDKRAERLAEREKRRLERLRESVRKREKDEAAARARAERLFETKLNELLAGKAEKKPDKAKEPSTSDEP